MDSYRVVIEARAERELREVPFPFRRQINQRIYKLKTTPAPVESEVLAGSVRWLHVYGSYVVYNLDESARVVTILAIL